MIKHIHNKLVKERTPFGLGCVGAFIMGVGGIANNITDWFWLLGDMRIHTYPHHYYTAAGLFVSLIVMLVSYIWLYSAVNQYLTKKMHKDISNKEKINARRRAKRAKDKATKLEETRINE